MTRTTTPPSRRDRKKNATRQRIADVATMLFLERGFDAVTVNEIAEAADVSKVTVFNHFPRKEDMLLDRAPEARQVLSEAIKDRANDESPLAALRRTLTERARAEHPLGGFADRFAGFWRLIAASPALRDRARELYQDLEDHLAGLIAEATGVPPTDTGARMTAAVAMAVYRTAYTAAAARIMAGESAVDVVDDHIALVDRALRAMERAMSAPEGAVGD